MYNFWMYICNNCGYNSTSKLGKCPSCQEFGTFEEDKSKTKFEKKSKHKTNQGRILENNKKFDNRYYNMTNKEFLRIFGKGIKSGGMYLLGGDPGIGKSTIILQILDDLLKNNEVNIGYFSGEEDISQVNERKQRILPHSGDFQVFHSTHLEDIISTSTNKNHNILIVDSIQTIYANNIDSASGSINQIKFCTEKLSEFAKENNITVWIIGHMTKGGEIAGPKYLEHIVDVVLYLEGDRFGQLRFLRSQKNRFHNTDESGIFEMTLFGLTPVYDIKQRILEAANTDIPGNTLSIGLDNGRAVLVNIEVLINKTKLKYPSRNCIGVGQKRVDLVIAILERYLKIDLSFFDIFVNVPGEFSFGDSGLDLAIAIGIYCQYHNIKITDKLVFLAELGLGGQLVNTQSHEKRKKECPNGFEIIDKKSIKNIIEIKNIIG